MTGAPSHTWAGRFGHAIDLDTLIRALAIATGGGVFLALIGPFGTAVAPLGLRFVYWLSLAVGGTGLGVLTTGVVEALFGVANRWRYVLAVATALLMTPPATLAVYAVTRWLFAWNIVYDGLLGLAGPVFLVCLAMNLINALAHHQPIQTHPSATPDDLPPRFLSRLPRKLQGGEIHAVEAQDHYLRLHTSKGSDLILMRLSDAVAELDGLEGAQTHRSWWVAKSAVQQVRRIDGRAILELPGGVEAPVSRNIARALKAQGWF